MTDQWVAMRAKKSVKLGLERQFIGIDQPMVTRFFYRSLALSASLCVLGGSVALASDQDKRAPVIAEADAHLLEGFSEAVKEYVKLSPKYEGRPRFAIVDSPLSAQQAERAAVGEVSKILYVNRCVGGCVITPGQSDSRDNTSSIPDEPSVLSEFAFSDEAFQEVVDCVRDVFAPYDLQVVTEDPGEVFHHEAILAGVATEMGLDADFGGIAQGSGGDCTPRDNIISFSFANSSFYNGDTEDMCWTVAQEAAHSYGLGSHTFDCHDPMTYLSSACGRKYFRNKSYRCGEFEFQGPQEQCDCGGVTRNNHALLVNVFGYVNPVEAPTLEIVLPAEDANVDDGFSVIADSSDRRGIDKVEVWVSGNLQRTLAGNLEIERNNPSNQEHRISTSIDGWPDGYADVEVRAYNDLGEFTAITRRVLKGAPCTDAAACLEGQMCIDGGCRFAEASSQLGEACSVDQDCIAGVCGDNGSEKLCALSCTPGVSDACAEGFECSSDGACFPADSGGCCSVAGNQGSSRAPWMLILAFLGALVAIRRSSSKANAA